MEFNRERGRGRGRGGNYDLVEGGVDCCRAEGSPTRDRSKSRSRSLPSQLDMSSPTPTSAIQSSLPASARSKSLAIRDAKQRHLLLGCTLGCTVSFLIYSLILSGGAITPRNAAEADVTGRESRADSHHPPILYGHVHMSKTGGSSLNGVFANRFERVCGHKGYSYDAYADNERAKEEKRKKGRVVAGNRTQVDFNVMSEIGYENCDYISHEDNWWFWNNTFAARKFHGTEMELHVPCRGIVDHLMSLCNHIVDVFRLDCEKNESEWFDSVDRCYFANTVERFDKRLLDHFTVKCFDFKKQFTVYTDYMSKILTPRRFTSEPFVKRETNEPRDKNGECIWNNTELLARTEERLLRTSDYYSFCDQCMGTEMEITRESGTDSIEKKKWQPPPEWSCSHSSNSDLC